MKNREMMADFMPMIEAEGNRANFNEQYDHPRTFTAGNESFEIYEVTPKHPKTEVPILFGPGFPPNPNLHKENIFHLYNKDRRVVFPYAPHGIDAEDIITETDEEKIPEVARAELRKVAAFFKTMD